MPFEGHTTIPVWRASHLAHTLQKRRRRDLHSFVPNLQFGAYLNQPQRHIVIVPLSQQPHNQNNHTSHCSQYFQQSNRTS